jgi:hypothetical protein
MARISLPRACPSPADRGARNERRNGSVGGRTIVDMIGEVIGRETKIKERKWIIKGFMKSGICSSTPAASLTRSHDSNSVLDSICNFLSEVSYNYKFPPISLIISNTLLAYIQMFLGSKNRLDFLPTFRLKFALRVRILFSSSSSSRIVSRVRFAHRLCS